MDLKDEERLLIEEVRKPLSDIQDFDASTLSREVYFGTINKFRGVVAPAKQLIGLFKQLSPESLDDFSRDQLLELKNISNECLKCFDQILTFKSPLSNLPLMEQNSDVKELDKREREILINNITSVYQRILNALHPLIIHSLHQSAKRKSDIMLESIRKVAAEAGVTQQSIYFKQEADKNETKATYWIIATIWTALALLVYAFSSLFLHVVACFSLGDIYKLLLTEDYTLAMVTCTSMEESPFRLVQISISKILIFAVLGYVFYFSAKNYLYNKHNATINRHRQNALQTYQALVEAASEKQYKDVILVHAASCIYAPQPTGYAGNSAETPGAKSVIELLSKSATEK